MSPDRPVENMISKAVETEENEDLGIRYIRAAIKEPQVEPLVRSC